MAASREQAKKNLAKSHGRPKGSTTRPQIRDYITDEEIRDLVKTLKEQAIEKPELLKFLLEHVFGKAPQILNFGEDGDNFVVNFNVNQK